MVELNKERIKHIDFLKFLGILLIILAHVEPPFVLFTIRSFDVPLFVIISAYLGEKSYRRHLATSDTLGYYKSRIKKLVGYTWLFLIFYFLYLYISDGTVYGWSYYLFSFCLSTYGVEYVWIMLVLLYVSLLMPVLYRVGYNAKSVSLVALIYILYELSLFFEWLPMTPQINSTLYTIVPYGVLAYIGFNYKKMSNKQRVLIGCFFLTIFAGLTILHCCEAGHFVSITEYKYPARLYYLAYGIGVSLPLLVVSEKLPEVLKNNAVVNYVAAHTQGIYYWHILALNLWGRCNFQNNWYIKYAFVVALAVAFTIIFNHAVSYFNKLFRGAK